MKLYEHEAQLTALAEQIGDAQERGEEVPDEALALLDEYALGATEKRDRVGDFLQFLDERTKSCADAAERAYKAQTAIINVRERLLDYTLRVMRSQGVTAALGERWKFAVRAGVECVEIEDESKLPPECVRTKTTTVPDKLEIGKRLKAGTMVYGAKMVRGEPTLQLRALAATDRPGETKRLGAGEAEGVAGA
jgi:hypothetical protein